MRAIDFTAAYYVKLGRGGVWETDSIETGKVRIGWDGQSLEDIHARRWNAIECQMRLQSPDQLPGAVTTDFRALKMIVESSSDDVWVTCYQAKLWWTRLSPRPVEEDNVSKFRSTGQPWSDRNVNGRLLALNDLPGKLAQLQAFRGTICRVHYVDLLHRTLNGIRSPLALAISDQHAILSERLAEAIKELHWKDFETLVDLVFRATGWMRVSVLGQQAKAYDLELRESITGNRYVVQVKSQANLADLRATVANFSADDFCRVFFVVHSPAADLAHAQDLPDHVEIVSPQQLGRLAIDAGLAEWVEDKVS
jgi:hypothetical protein